MKLKLLSSSVNPTTLSFVITTSAVLYNGFSTQSIILLVASLCLAFVLSMSMGANDVANSFGTSVGSGALTLRQALVLASIFETIGATTLGYKVASMIRKSIFNISIFDGKLDEYVYGNIAALISGFTWMIIATLCGLPVSGSHSIVGATLGYSLAINGFNGINWTAVINIAISWITSPIISGFLTLIFYGIIYYGILTRINRIPILLIALPFIYALPLWINSFSIFYSPPNWMHIDNLTHWLPYVIATGAAIITAILIRLVLVRYYKKKIKEMNLESAPDNSTQITNITEDPGIALVQEKESEIKTNLRKIQNDKIQHKIFLALQIMTAIFASFAHGANDISNSISPLASIWEVLSTNTNTLQAKHQTPIWILFYGSIGVALGLWIFGARVIETVGKKITNITTESGFCIEIGSAITVLVASNIGLPISSTHCKVGSIVAISKFTADKRIKWKLFTKILFGWFLTLPVTVLLSAGIMCIFKYTIL